MAATTELVAEHPALALQAAILARPMTPERHMADAIRALAIDATEASRSGHPGLPMGMADVATVLFTRFLKFDAADPRWPDRDRFVLSAGHGSMLLYALIYLTGYAGMTIEDIRNFRQLHSPAAGHLCLSKLTVLYDDNHVSIDGDTSLAFSDDVAKRFSSYGWATKQVDGHDPQQVAAALSFAIRSKKPTLILCRTIIGLGAPHKAGTNAVHGSPLGPEEAADAKAALGWHEPPFAIPPDLLEQWHAVGARGAGQRRAWLKRLAHNSMRAEFERAIAGKLPENWHEAVASLKQGIAETKPKIASRASSQRCLDALVPATPELVGGSADLTGSNLTLVKGMGSVAPGNYSGRYIHFGDRKSVV